MQSSRLEPLRDFTVYAVVFAEVFSALPCEFSLIRFFLMLLCARI